MKKIPENIQKQFEEISQKRKNELDDELNLLHEVLNICDSPIEQMFILGISKHWLSTSPFQEGSSLGITSKLENFMSVDDSGNWDYRGEIETTIYPQYPITVEGKNYRADLLLKIRGQLLLPKSDKTWEAQNRSINIIVEIDGHDFHERTKEQAQRDKSRDRILSKYGYIVIRYTGSEVFNDVYKATTELAGFIFAKLFSVTKIHDLFYEI